MAGSSVNALPSLWNVGGGAGDQHNCSEMSMASGGSLECPEIYYRTLGVDVTGVDTTAPLAEDIE